jgi:hypothetical protein
LCTEFCIRNLINKFIQETLDFFVLKTEVEFKNINFAFVFLIIILVIIYALNLNFFATLYYIFIGLFEKFKFTEIRQRFEKFCVTIQNSAKLHRIPYNSAEFLLIPYCLWNGQKRKKVRNSVLTEFHKHPSSDLYRNQNLIRVLLLRLRLYKNIADPYESGSAELVLINTSLWHFCFRNK